MRILWLVSLICLFGMFAREAVAIDPYAGNDPYWVLLHEPAAIAELKLNPAQQRSLQLLTDELDLLVEHGP
ncbi:MAG: hypothetical protein HY290_20990 [Planctomycetia bacterium]|nr:hypothetical protein [Planctomycetia bacterium]